MTAVGEPERIGNMELTGRTVLITGGTSGIGLETAAPLLARDNVVIVPDAKTKASTRRSCCMERQSGTSATIEFAHE
jgi:NAD(P)-dependent dehydrogenase (short-subunit alcohol dehydrogenase family)